MKSARRRLAVEALESRNLMTVGLDANFGSNGIVTAPESVSAPLVDVAVDSVPQNGKMIVASYIHSGRPGGVLVLSRYNFDGSLDTSFGFGGLARLPLSRGNESFRDLAIAPTGDIYVLFSSGDPSWLAKLSPDGQLRLDFGNQGLVPIAPRFSSEASIAFANDGHFFVASNHFGNSLQLAKYKPDGTLDGSFADKGILRKPVSALWQVQDLVYIDGGLILSATYQSESLAHLQLLRVLADGAIDGGFGDGGAFTRTLADTSQYMNSPTFVTLVDEMGDLNLVGTTRFNEAYQFVVWKLDGTGQLVENYGNEGVVSIDTGEPWRTYVRDAELLPDGRLLITGTMGVVPAPVALKVDRTGLDWDLQAALPWLKVDTRSVAASVVGERVLAAYNNSEADDIHLVAFTFDGRLDESFGDGGVVPHNLGYSWNSGQGSDILELEDGKVLTVGGSFLPLGHGRELELLLNRRLSDGDLDTSFGNSGTLSLPQDLLQSPLPFFTTFGEVSYLVSTSNNAISVYKLAADGTIDTNFGADGRVAIPREGISTLLDVTAVNNGFLVTGLSSLFDDNNYLISKYDLAGGLVEDFADGGTIAVPHMPRHCCHSSHLTLAPDGGFFAFFYIPASGGIIEVRRYDAGGNWDESFNDSEWWLNGYISVTSRVIAGDSGQMFLVSNQGTRIEIRKMLSTGAFDHGFGTRGLVQIDLPTPYQAIARMAVEIDAENGFVIAVSARNGQDSESLLIRAHSNGELDRHFGTAGYLFLGMSRFDDTVNALSIARDGDIYFAGTRLTAEHQEAVFGRLGENGRPARPWHNFFQRTDTNNDGISSPLDILYIINFLNAHGSRRIFEEFPAFGLLDVSADNLVSPLDILLNVHSLNARLEGELVLVDDYFASEETGGYFDERLLKAKRL